METTKLTKSEVEAGQFDVIHEGASFPNAVIAADAICAVLGPTHVYFDDDANDWIARIDKALCQRAAAQLEDGWDAEAVAACIEHVSFAVVPNRA